MSDTVVAMIQKQIDFVNGSIRAHERSIAEREAELKGLREDLEKRKVEKQELLNALTLLVT